MEIFVSNKASRPLYEQIRAQVKTQIMNGTLNAGEALPSIRSLAKSLKISVLTVQKAYDLLQEDSLRQRPEKAVLYPPGIRISIWKNSRKRLRGISMKRSNWPGQAEYRWIRY